MHLIENLKIESQTTVFNQRNFAWVLIDLLNLSLMCLNSRDFKLDLGGINDDIK